MKKTCIALLAIVGMGTGLAEAALPDYAAQVLQKDYQLLEDYWLQENIKRPQTVKLDRSIPVTLGKLVVSGNKKLPSSYVLKRIHCSEGKALNLKRLEKDLLLFNNTGRSQLQAELVPTNKDGVVNLLLKVTEPKSKSSFWVDNGGLKAVGSLRVAFQRESYGFLHNDDVLSGVKYWSRGAWGGYTTYDTPFSHKGLRAFGGLAKERVKAVKGVWDGKYKSDLYDFWGSLRHPLRITEHSKLETFGELHHKWYDTDYFGGARFADKKLNSGSYGISLRSFDKKGATYAKAAATIYVEKTAAGAEGDSSRRGCYWQGEVFRLQDLGREQRLTAKVVGLYSNKKALPATEGIAIGGACSVRGFEEGLLELSRGMYGTIEYSRPLARTPLRGHVFYDYGFGYVNTKAHNQSLTSCGVGLSYSKKGWSSSLTIGIPLSHPADEKSAKAKTHFHLQKNI